MFINHTITGTGGMLTAHHGLIDAQLNPALDAFTLRFASWASEAQRLAGQAPIDRINIGVPVSGLDLSGGLAAALGAGVLASEYFEGGTIVVDAAETLEGVKSRKLAELLEARRAAELAPVVMGGTEFDADLDAQRRIVGGVVAALVPRLAWINASLALLSDAASIALPEQPAFELDWTVRDGSTVTLDEDCMYGLGLELMRSVDGAFCIGRPVLAALADATEIEDALALAWPAHP